MSSARLQGTSLRGSRSRNAFGGPGLRKAASLANLEATTDRLRDILLQKEVYDSTAGGRRAPTQAVDPGLAPVGEDVDQPSPPPSPPQGGDASVASVGQESPKMKATVSIADNDMAPPPNFGDDREREAFVTQVCADSTRLDVRDWVSRIYETLKKAKKEGEEDGGKARRHRKGGKAWSSSQSDTTTTHTATTSALLTAGGSVVGSLANTNAPSRKAPSLISAESMVVHPGKKIELLSTEERLRAYLNNDIPELTAHVNKYVSVRAEEVRREIDEELVESHLLKMRRMQVFNGKSNFLRWQNSRRIVLQKRLDAETPFWMLEAVQSWDQKTAMQAREDEVSEQDLVYDYLTKRAAHINTNKLATEIPLFKTLHSSYSLPRMWRDKYLEMF